MELSDFVAKTLADIAEGVDKGAKAAAEFGAVVNPKGFLMGAEGYTSESTIEFTVALTVTEGTASKAGIGVVAGIFALGAQGASNATAGSTTHVKFSVKVLLPSPIRRSES